MNEIYNTQDELRDLVKNNKKLVGDIFIVNFVALAVIYDMVGRDDPAVKREKIKLSDVYDYNVMSGLATVKMKVPDSDAIAALMAAFDAKIGNVSFFYAAKDILKQMKEGDDFEKIRGRFQDMMRHMRLTPTFFSSRMLKAYKAWIDGDLTHKDFLEDVKAAGQSEKTKGFENFKDLLVKSKALSAELKEEPKLTEVQAMELAVKKFAENDTDGFEKVLDENKNIHPHSLVKKIYYESFKNLKDEMLMVFAKWTMRVENINQYTVEVVAARTLFNIMSKFFDMRMKTQAGVEILEILLEKNIVFKTICFNDLAAYFNGRQEDAPQALHMALLETKHLKDIFVENDKFILSAMISDNIKSWEKNALPRLKFPEIKEAMLVASIISIETFEGKEKEERLKDIFEKLDAMSDVQAGKLITKAQKDAAWRIEKSAGLTSDVPQEHLDAIKKGIDTFKPQYEKHRLKSALKDIETEKSQEAPKKRRM